MDAIEKEIQRYFASRPAPLGRRASAGWPDEGDFYRYLTDRMEGEELGRMVAHLRTDDEDRRFVAGVRELFGRMAEADGEGVPADLVARAAGLSKGASSAVSCPHCRRAITPFKSPPVKQKLFNALWLAAGCVFLAVSFYVPKYFIQWTALGALCLMKWIVDSKQTRTQILVYKALAEAPEAKTRHLHPSDTPL